MRWFGLSFAPKPMWNTRFARQYRCELPPEFPLGFALLRLRSPSCKSQHSSFLTHTTFKLMEFSQTKTHIHTHARMERRREEEKGEEKGREGMKWERRMEK